LNKLKYIFSQIIIPPQKQTQTKTKGRKRQNMALYQNSTAVKTAVKENKFSVGTSSEDNYITPLYAWKYIQHLIPTKRIWEPFYCDGSSGKKLSSLGFKVRHKNEDFFKTKPKENKPYTIVTNPPYSIMKEVLIELKKRDKPFILLITLQKISTQYIRTIFKNGEIKLCLPPRRIKFIKASTGENASIPDCCYLCYKIPKVKDGLTFLPEETKEIKEARIQEENKAKKKPKKKNIVCRCGCVISNNYYKKHLTTKKHEQLCIVIEKNIMGREDKI